LAVIFKLARIWSQNVIVIVAFSIVAGFANGAVVSLLLHIGSVNEAENTMLFMTMFYFAHYMG
jgi:hypothetical protein